MSYNSKYSGQQVEDLLDQVANGNVGGGGGITSETDPIFSVSPASGITEKDIASWNSKQNTIADLATIRDGAAKGATAIQQHQSLDGYVKDADLASVAKSGSYNDLSNKPTIPSAVTEATVSGWGFTKNQGTYVKPSSGIPLSDLNDSAQESIGKGDEAYRYLGTLISDLNGKQDKIADLDAIRSGAALGATALQSIPSEYVTKSELGQKGYATTSYVNTNLNIFNTNLNKKQDKLVSGTNIKTINGNSILGSGDIVIEEGSSAYPVVDHGTSNGTFVLTPNIFHKWNSVSSLSLTLAEPTDNTICNEYLFEFKSGDSATTLTLPAGIGWISEPNIEPNLTYQGSIVNNVGIIVGSKIPSVFAIYVVGSKKYFSFDKNMTWEVFVNSAYNDGTFSISSGKVRLYDSYYVYYGSETTEQTSEQTIIENGTYNVM